MESFLKEHSYIPHEHSCMTHMGMKFKKFLVKGLAHKNTPLKIIWLHCVGPSLCTLQNTKQEMYLSYHILSYHIILKNVLISWPCKACHQETLHCIGTFITFLLHISFYTAHTHLVFQMNHLQNVVIIVILWERKKKDECIRKQHYIQI